MSKDNTTLKPCPFCGEEDNIRETSSFVECENCECLTHDMDRWNTRPLEEALKAKADGLVTFLEEIKVNLYAHHKEFIEDKIDEKLKVIRK